jgi:hypothetical protein
MQPSGWVWRSSQIALIAEEEKGVVVRCDLRRCGVFARSALGWRGI